MDTPKVRHEYAKGTPWILQRYAINTPRYANGHAIGVRQRFPQARLKLIKIRKTPSFSKPDVKQLKVFVLSISLQILKITKSTAGTSKFQRVPKKMINHMFKGFFSLTTSSCYTNGFTDRRYRLKSK